MKPFQFTILFFLIVCLAGINTATFAQDQPITLVYFENGLTDLNNYEQKIALQMLLKELTKEIDHNISLIAVHDFSEMLALAKTGKVNFSIINSLNYIKEKEHLAPYIDKHLWAIQRSPEKQEDYVLVVRKSLKYKGLNSLYGKRLSLYQDYLLMKFYLQFIIKKNSGVSLENFFASIKNTKTASQTVLDVFFGVSDVCIVPQHILNLATELNPAINDNIQIVYHSGEHFVPALVLFFKNTPETINNLVGHNLETLEQTARGQELLSMFHIQSIVKTEADKLQYMVDMYNEYLGRLK